MRWRPGEGHSIPWKMDPETAEHKLELSVPLSVSATELRWEGPERAFVLLHGYGETKDRMIRKLSASLRAHGNRLIALNAPFPAPQLSEQGPKEGYSWFFRSLRTGVTLAHPSVNAQLFARLIENHGLRETPLVAIGFSQGGFVLPFLARELGVSTTLVGISSGIVPQDVPSRLNASLHLIHGTDDETLKLEESKGWFEEVRDRFSASSFTELPGGHGIDAAKTEALQALLGQLEHR